MNEYEERCYEDDPRWQDIQFEHEVDMMTQNNATADRMDRQATFSRAGGCDNSNKGE